MANDRIAEKVAPLLTPVVEAQGFELYDLEYLKEGADFILRLFIDKNGGVGINDCENVSRAAEAVLDANDPIPTAYILEVSSPGIERKLKKDAHFIKAAGERVELRLFKAVDGKKQYQGILKGLEDNAIVITDEQGAEQSFSRALVSVCRLKSDFKI